jgi:hypothetical protein
MLHHYVQRGRDLGELINLDGATKLFMKVSMILYYEEEAKRWGSGGHG